MELVGGKIGKKGDPHRAALAREPEGEGRRGEMGSLPAGEAHQSERATPPPPPQWRQARPLVRRTSIAVDFSQNAQRQRSASESLHMQSTPRTVLNTVQYKPGVSPTLTSGRTIRVTATSAACKHPRFRLSLLPHPPTQTPYHTPTPHTHKSAPAGPRSDGECAEERLLATPAPALAPTGFFSSFLYS